MAAGEGEDDGGGNEGNGGNYGNDFNIGIESNDGSKGIGDVTMAATIKTIMMAMRKLLVENIYLFDTLAGTAAIATLER